MHVNRIDHINIRTPALLETVAFYEAVLGLRRGPVAAPVDQDHNAWLFDTAGKPLIHINMPDPGEAPRDPKNRSRLHHVAFECTGVEDMAEKLSRLGIAFEHRDISSHGFVQFVVHDPNGICVELNFRTD